MGVMAFDDDLHRYPLAISTVERRRFRPADLVFDPTLACRGIATAAAPTE